MMSLLNLPDDRFGLLSLGLRLMSTPGSLGQAFGQAGMGALGDMQQNAGNRQRRELVDLQTQQARAQLEEAARAQQSQAALKDYVGGLNPDAGMPETMPGPRREPMQFDPFQAVSRGAEIAPSFQMAQLLQKSEPEAFTLKPGEVRYQGGRQVASVPAEAPKDPETVRMLKMIYGEGTPAYQAALQRLGEKVSTHQPPVATISYGTGATPMQMPDGSIVLGQLSSTPGAPPQIVSDPRTGQPMRPPPQNRDTKLPAELQRMQIAGDAMSKLMTDYEEMLKKHNPRDPMVQANPQIRADVQALKRNIELQFKELQALGALAGPDIDIIRQSLSDPFTLAGAYYGRDGLLSQVSRARQLVKARSDAVLKSQGQTAPTSKQVKRTGTAPNGRKVVEYTDGSIQYAD